MRKLLALTLAVFLAVAAVALAARPPGGSKFKGVTDARKVKGSKGQQFRDPVVIKVAASRKRIKTLKTGIPPCFGSGGPPPKQNPYTHKGYAATFRSVAIKRSGRFRKSSSFKLGGLPTKATLAGKFFKKGGKWRARGKITYTQRLAMKCGPTAMSFTARKR